MRELRDNPGEPDDASRAERAVPVRERSESRSRGEYAAELRLGASLEVVGRFEPRRAGLPEVSAGDAAAYLDARQAERPWLAAARNRSPEVQRLFAALDQGGGHAHIRHEGWVTEEMSRRRVAYLEDPAQLDPAKRAAGIDGLLPGDRRHKCGSIATRIADPDAFAVAIAQGIEHPDVRAALDAEFSKRRAPGPVVLPIAGLLGPDGYRHCTGWQLDTVEGSVKTAAERRDAAAGVNARPVETFDGGTITFRFGPNLRRSGYEIVTMYANPPDGG
ncbi:MAG TPA: hypothetical protein VGS06_02070 [Streptosporangiaceae bacterium]|nr:hypothetical protein [Streptosporangiaceae bacterium]